MNWKLRERALEGLESLGIILDKKKNEAAVSREKEALITTHGSPIKGEPYQRGKQ
jgi:acetate kinase